MLHTAAVDVSLLRGEGQPGDLVKGEVFVGVGRDDSDSLCHVLTVPGPPDCHRGGVELSHVTDESVLHPQLHIVPGVDGAVGGICTETHLSSYSTSVSLWFSMHK